MKKTSLHTLISSILLTLVLDLFVTHNSIITFRLIFNSGFFLVSTILLKNFHSLHSSTYKTHSINVSKPYFILCILLNILILMNLINYVPVIGSVNDDILAQSIWYLPYILFFLGATLLNTLVLYITFINRTILFLKWFFYSMLYISANVFAIKFSFELGGILYIKLMLSFVSFFLIYHNVANILTKRKTPVIEYNEKHVELIILSIGIFLLFYSPFINYSLFSDNSIVIGSTYSILFRNSLEPYFISSNYYNPIGGYFSVLFYMVSKIESILASSTAGFTIFYFFMPFLIYDILTRFYTENKSLAIIGSILVFFMDGLGLVILPNYWGALSSRIINWKISPITYSLYMSNIQWLYFNPYKIFGMASTLGVMAAQGRKTRFKELFSGLFLALSIVNPRQLYSSFILIMLLSLLNKLELKKIVNIIISFILFLGALNLNLIFQIINGILYNMSKMKVISNSYYLGIIEGIKNNYLTLFNPNLFLISVSMIVLLIYIFMIYRQNDLFNNELKTYYYETSFVEPSLFFFNLVLLLIYSINLMYIIASLQNIELFSNIIVKMLMSLFLRYHILMVVVIYGIFYTVKINGYSVTRYSLNVFITFLFNGMGHVLQTFSMTPLSIFIISLPILNNLVKQGRTTIISLFTILSIIGILSSTLYLGTVESGKADIRYSEVGSVLGHLGELNAGEEVYSPPEYNLYYTRRTVKMANLVLSEDPMSRYWLLDKTYLRTNSLNEILENTRHEIVFDGDAFMLLHRLDANS